MPPEIESKVNTKEVEEIATRAVSQKLAEDKTRSELDKIKKERDEFEARLKEKEEAEKKAKLAAMQPDEKVQAQLQDLTRQLQERDQRSAQELNAVKMQLRAAELTAYRELVLRKYGNEIIADMVIGNSEAEIDHMAEVAAKSYKDIYAKAREEISAQLQVQNPQQMIPVPVVAAPPQNPAYVPTYTQPYASFPTPVNAESVAQLDGSQVDFKDITSEEAVRSGRYSGEARARILDQMKRMPGAPNIGYTPRYSQAAPPQHVALPNGVMQPQGIPTGPVMPPQMMQYQQVPQQQQPMHMPIQAVQGVVQPTAMDAAREAVARTHAGQNPTMGANSGAASALQQSQEYAARNGVTPQTAFHQRFNPTPPITGQA